MHNFSARLWSTLRTNSRRTADPPWPTTHANALGSWCFGPSLAGAATAVAQQHGSVGRKKEIPMLPTLNSRVLTGFRNFCGSGTIPQFNLVAPHMTPQNMPKQKRTFDGVSRYFRTFLVPTELDGGKPCFIWTQWTWKPSPRSIGFDADENGSRALEKNSL